MLKSIPNFPGYLVSDDGRIFSTRNRWGETPPRELATSGNSHGYLGLILRVGGRQTRLSVHRAVAEAFLGPRPDALQINHIDGNKRNNAVANLEYVTPAENIAHYVRLRSARRVA